MAFRMSEKTTTFYVHYAGENPLLAVDFRHDIIFPSLVSISCCDFQDHSLMKMTMRNSTKSKTMHARIIELTSKSEQFVVVGDIICGQQTTEHVHMSQAIEDGRATMKKFGMTSDEVKVMRGLAEYTVKTEATAIDRSDLAALARSAMAQDMPSAAEVLASSVQSKPIVVEDGGRAQEIRLSDFEQRLAKVCEEYGGRLVRQQIQLEAEREQKIAEVKAAFDAELQKTVAEYTNQLAEQKTKFDADLKTARDEYTKQLGVQKSKFDAELQATRAERNKVNSDWVAEALRSQRADLEEIHARTCAKELDLLRTELAKSHGIALEAALARQREELTKTCVAQREELEKNIRADIETKLCKDMERQMRIELESTIRVELEKGREESKKVAEAVRADHNEMQDALRSERETLMRLIKERHELALDQQRAIFEDTIKKHSEGHKKALEKQRVELTEGHKKALEKQRVELTSQTDKATRAKIEKAVRAEFEKTVRLEFEADKVEALKAANTEHEKTVQELIKQFEATQKTVQDKHDALMQSVTNDHQQAMEKQHTAYNEMLKKQLAEVRKGCDEALKQALAIRNRQVAAEIHKQLKKQAESLEERHKTQLEKQKSEFEVLIQKLTADCNLRIAEYEEQGIAPSDKMKHLLEEIRQLKTQLQRERETIEAEVLDKLIKDEDERAASSRKRPRRQSLVSHFSKRGSSLAEKLQDLEQDYKMGLLSTMEFYKAIISNPDFTSDGAAIDCNDIKTDTEASAKKAYFRLSLYYHPDKQTDIQSEPWLRFCNVMFRCINNAKDIPFVASAYPERIFPL